MCSSDLDGDLIYLENVLTHNQNTGNYFHRIRSFRELQLALAVKVYRSEQGHNPERLEQLVPRILTAIPRDPITNREFTCRVTDKGFAIGHDEDGGIKYGIEYQSGKFPMEANK